MKTAERSAKNQVTIYKQLCEKLLTEHNHATQSQIPTD